MRKTLVQNKKTINSQAKKQEVYLAHYVRERKTITELNN